MLEIISDSIFDIVLGTMKKPRQANKHKGGTEVAATKKHSKFRHIKPPTSTSSEASISSTPPFKPRVLLKEIFVTSRYLLLIFL